MKLILIPPYKGMNWTPTQGQYMLVELVANMEKRGQLEGIEIDIDEGWPYPAEIDPVNRDEQFLAHISVGVVRKVREYSEMGKYDAIIQTGDLDPGFFGSRAVAKIPFISLAHSAFHVASLIGERFTFFAVTDPCAMIVRRFAQNCGFSHKLVSVRYPSFSSTYMASFVKKYKKEERSKVPEVEELVATLTTQCIAAIEEDRVDTIIFGCPAVQVYMDEVRQELDRKGFSEIPIINGLYAAVEMSKALVNMKLTQAPRAYPSDALKVRPAFR